MIIDKCIKCIHFVQHFCLDSNRLFWEVRYGHCNKCGELVDGCEHFEEKDLEKDITGIKTSLRHDIKQLIKLLDSVCNYIDLEEQKG